MADEEITLPEVGRRLTALSGSLATLTEKVDKIVTRDAADLLRISYLDKRVTALESIVQRLTWTVVLAVVGAGLTLILKVA